MAKALGWGTQRRRRHASATLAEAAELVKAYIEGLPKGSPARGRMPTQSEVIERGRHDVRYAMQVRNHPHLTQREKLYISSSHPGLARCLAPIRARVSTDVPTRRCISAEPPRTRSPMV